MAEYEINGSLHNTSVMGLYIESEGDDCFFLKPLKGIDFDEIFKGDPNWRISFNRSIILYSDVMGHQCQDAASPKAEKLAYIVWSDDQSLCYEREVFLDEEEKLMFNTLLAQFALA